MNAPLRLPPKVKMRQLFDLDELLEPGVAEMLQGIRSAAPMLVAKRPMKISVWAQSGNLRLPSGTSTRSGALRLYPYQPDILDSLQEAGIEVTVLMGVPRIGKSTIPAIGMCYYGVHEGDDTIFYDTNSKAIQVFHDTTLHPIMSASKTTSKMMRTGTTRSGMPEDKWYDRLLENGAFQRMRSAEVGDSFRRVRARKVFLSELGDPAWHAGDEGDKIDAALKRNRVIYGGLIYECVEDHTSAGFYQTKPGQDILVVTSIGYTMNLHPYWKAAPSHAPLKLGATDFFTSAPGREVQAHIVLRSRKALLERSRALRVTLTYTWEDAGDVTLRDCVRAEIPWPDGSHRAIVGKVVGIRRELISEVAGIVEIVVAVSLGTGDVEAVPDKVQPAYGVAGKNYFSSRYLRPAPDGPETFGVGGDTAYIVDADPVRRPIITEFLRESFYSVESVDRSNEAGVQLRAAMLLGAVGRDPRWGVQRNPTRIKVKMRPLTMEGILTRDVYVAGSVLTSPRGIDLINGDEP